MITFTSFSERFLLRIFSSLVLVTVIGNSQPSSQQKAGDAMRERMRRKQDSFEPTRQLMLAIKLDDKVAAEKALEQGADPNMTIWDAGMRNSFDDVNIGATSLGLAIQFKRVDMVRLVLDRGANVNFQSGGSGATPIQVAIYYQQPDIVSLLLARKADPSLGLPLKDAMDCAQASAACREIVEILKRAGSETYFGPKPPRENEPFQMLSGGSLKPLEACVIRETKNEDVDLWTINGQSTSADISDAAWPVFYIRFQPPPPPGGTEKLGIFPLSEKVGRREFRYQETTPDPAIVVVQGRRVTETIYRFEVGAAIGPAGRQYLIRLFHHGPSAFCFYYRRN